MGCFRMCRHWSLHSTPKREVAEAIKEIGKVPAYTTLWKQADLKLTDVPTKECQAFENSKNVYGEVDASYGKIKE